MKNREKTGKAFQDKMAFAGTCGSCTDLCAGCIA